MWGLARCTREQALACSREVGEVAAGSTASSTPRPARVGGCGAASGGFDFYIEAILGERAMRFERSFFNRARFLDERVWLDFHEGLACDKCAVCKGRVCEAARAEAARVVFVGDGASDRCAIGKADLVCAVEGSTLARGCAERGVEHRTFADFGELLPIF